MADRFEVVRVDDNTNPFGGYLDRCTAYDGTGRLQTGLSQ